MISRSTGGGRNVDSGQMNNDVHRRIRAFRFCENPILCPHGGTHGITFLHYGINLFLKQRAAIQIHEVIGQTALSSTCQLRARRNFLAFIDACRCTGMSPVLLKKRR